MPGKSPRQNRVTPEGEIIIHSARGLFMGNRGCLHDNDGQLGRARWRSTTWIVCRLEFKGRRREIMAPGRYTELFFLDEAVALAAGHRPCAECRREDYKRFVAGWAEGHSSSLPASNEMDRVLHESRIDRVAKRQRTFRAEARHLPDGVFIRSQDTAVPRLVLGDRLIPFEDYAYGHPIPRPPDEKVDVLTPAPTVAAMRAGYTPRLHESVLN